MIPRLLALPALLAATAVSVAGQSRPRLQVTLPAPPARAEEGPTIQVRNVLSEKYVTDLLRNGFPARLHFRTELWSTGGISNSLQRRVAWDVLVRYDALRREYDVVRVQGDSATASARFAQFNDVLAEVERPMRAPIVPPRQGGGRAYYYSVRLELEMLSVSDLDEVERWLRGELKPAVRGERSPGTALGRGMRTLLARVLGGTMRRLEVRSETFVP